MTGPQLSFFPFSDPVNPQHVPDILRVNCVIVLPGEGVVGVEEIVLVAFIKSWVAKYAGCELPPESVILPVATPIPIILKSELRIFFLCPSGGSAQPSLNIQESTRSFAIASGVSWMYLVPE